MLSLYRLQCKQKKLFKSLSNSHISLSFLTHLPNGNDKYVHTLCSFLENHTRFQTKMGKVYTRFLTKNRAKTLADGAAHTYMAYIGSTPPPPGPDPTFLLLFQGNPAPQASVKTKPFFPTGRIRAQIWQLPCPNNFSPILHGIFAKSRIPGIP